jgi:hypothetical protein
MWIHSNSSTNVNVARLALTTDATGHTASDGSWIHVENTGLYIDNYENDAIIFSTNTLERMRVTSNASSATLGNGGVMKLLGTSGAVGVYTELQFYTYNAPTNQPPVSIGIIKTDNGGYENGEFYIATKATNANTAPVERMRVRSDGTVLIGKTTTGMSPNGTQLVSNGEIYISITNTANTLHVYDTTNSAYRFYVGGNGGISNYQANNTNLSDERTKKDIIPLESYWDKFKDIEIVKFKYKDQTHDDFNIGVIAQQVEEIAPEFIDIDGFGETPEDGIPFKTVYTSDLHHATIKVLQEAMAKIETLEAQNDALQSRIETLESK